jgi:multiple sugar transport system permease protein
MAKAILRVPIVEITLTFGTMGCFLLACLTYRYAFWILMAALLSSAKPRITLVLGYLLPYFEFNIWNHLHIAIVLLVDINNPFKLKMLYSFFLSIPTELGESTVVDGRTRFQAFRLAIIPAMWPVLISMGLFTFLFAYNEFAVRAMLLSRDN